MNGKIYQPGEYYNYPLIIKKLLTTPLATAPRQQIVYRDQWRYTYQDMAQRVHQLAASLAGLGVKAGDTVAVMDWDSHRYLECYFAIPMMGAVLQTLNWRFAPDQLLYTLNHGGARVILLHADFLPYWEKIRHAVQTATTVVILCDKDTCPSMEGAGQASYEALVAGGDKIYDFPDLDENTPATLFYTTGTTGNPKGVCFSHRQLVLHTLVLAVASGNYETIGGFRCEDVYMPLTPMFHVHAWGYPYAAAMLGAKQVYPGRYEPEMLLKLIRSEKVTFSHCVPTIMQMILNSATAQKQDLSRWKVVIGGAPLSKGLARAAKAFGIDLISGYGMSETCPVISVARPKAHMMAWEENRRLDILTKAGLPVPLVELDVVDADDKRLAHDGKSTGEVVMRAPWLTPSYFKEPDKTRELWINGWLHSGDMGHIDPEGYLTITDRLKDMIKSGGEWISSLDLENMMSQHPAVIESAVVGVSDPKWGERPLMLVVLKPAHGKEVGPEQLKAFMVAKAAAGTLPGYAVPDRYLIAEEIPKTSVGKVDKKKIREIYAGVGRKEAKRSSSPNEAG